jgi:hypothetical protein
MKFNLEEFRRSSENQPLKEVMERMFKVYQLEAKLQEVDLIQAWPELMGPAVAHRTQKIFLKGSVFHVQIDSSVAREELAKGKQVIIDRLNAYAGKTLITDIWFS